MGRQPPMQRTNSLKDVMTATASKLSITPPLLEIAQIDRAKNRLQKTKELESIIALKSRQIWRLQKEIKNLLKIQQQQAQTIEATFEDARKIEEKIQSYEQRQKIDSRTIKSLQDKLNEVTGHYQRMLTTHASFTEEEIAKMKNKKKQTQGSKPPRKNLEPMKTISPIPSISVVGMSTGAPLPPVGSKELPNSHHESGATQETMEVDRFQQVVNFFAAITSPNLDWLRPEIMIASETSKLFGASRATLFLLDADRQELVFYTKTMKEVRPFRCHSGTGIVGYVAKTAKLLRINGDLSKSEYFEARVDDPTGMRPSSTLYLPVRRTNSIIAVLQLMHLQKVFQESDEKLAYLIETMIGNVLLISRNVQKMEAKGAQDSALLETCKLISAELDIGPLSGTIIERASRLLNCESCSLYLVDAATKELCSINPSKDEKRFPLHRGIVGHVGSTGEEVVAKDASEDSRFDPEVDQPSPTKKCYSILCIPIKNENDDILGVIEMINKLNGYFDNNDIEVLRSLTEQIFASLSNAELFHKTLSGFNAALATQQKYQSLLEVAESLSSQLDEDNLIRFIMKRAKELVQAERCSLFLVDPAKNELRSKLAEGTEEIRFPMATGIAGHVATTGETLNITDAYEDPRFNVDIDKQTGYHTRSLLCMPIYNDQEEIIGVTQLINKKDGVFGVEDEEILRAFSIFCGITLRNARLYKQAIRSQHKTKALLDVAVALASDTNIQPLLKSIMKHARKLIKADRCSLFILDPDNKELRSQIAEGTEEIVMPLKSGIVGYVAQTGEEVAVNDVRKDPRFNPEVDKKTGYNTQSVLCIPIRSEEGKIIAVTQMINKRTGVFQEDDKQLLKAFAAFAAKSLSSVKTIKLSSNSSQTPEVDPRYIPSASDMEEITSWSFDVWKYSVDELIRYIIAIFEKFGLVKQFSIPLDRLLNFLKALSKTYRDVPYHNFYHAVDVLQTVFLFLWHAPILHQEIFSQVELLALLVAAICHDVDHGGLNNAFHVKAQTPLALLYKDMSVLETHHCSRSITLLSEVENDILSGLSEAQYSSVWKLVISSILATDMSLHFALLGQFETLIKDNSFNKDNPEHRKLIASILMKCADISNVVKPFSIAKYWAEILCAEFFMQGDMEKAKGLEVSPLMNRDTVVMPQMQLGFINSICIPIFTLLTNFLPSLKILMDTLTDNMTEWNRILQKGLSAIP